MANRCSMTGKVIDGPSDAVWDDGEWVSWEWINSQLHDQELRAQYPNADIELVKIFEDLVYLAQDYKQLTDRHLPLFGELGEIFAEITFGVKRHKPRTQGSDGRLGNDHVEIKTISPEKGSEKVSVKRQGNFNKLLVVKISDDFEFEARMIDRNALGKGKGSEGKATVSWSAMEAKALSKKRQGT